jgi:hypothetical protein
MFDDGGRGNAFHYDPSEVVSHFALTIEVDASIAMTIKASSPVAFSLPLYPVEIPCIREIFQL